MALEIRRLMESYTSSIFNIPSTTWTDFEYNSRKSDGIISTSVYYPLIVIILYCIGIPFGQYLMKDRKPFPKFPFKYVLFLHNIFLSLTSLYLTVFYLSTVLSYRNNNNYSYHAIFCELNQDDQRGTLNWLYYINLLIKYYELIDTVFLVIFKKPVIFLHSYHHPCTLVFAYIIIIESPGMEWIVLILNLLVHTIMYFYYAMSSIKIRLPFKIIITYFQIIQFILDIAAVFYVWYDVTIGTKRCYASLLSAYVATFVLGSYLILFLNFFRKTYSKKKEINSKPSKSININNNIQNGKHHKNGYKNGYKNGFKNGFNKNGYKNGYINHLKKKDQ